MLTNLGSALGHPGPQMALPGDFPMSLGATFLLALSITLPPLSADVPAPAQSLEKESRRTETNGMGALHVITRAWDGTIQASQNSDLNNTVGYHHLIQWMRWH